MYMYVINICKYVSVYMTYEAFQYLNLFDNETNQLT